MNRSLLEFKAISLLIAHMLIIYAAWKILYVNYEIIKNGKYLDLISTIFSLYSIITIIIFSFSLVYSIKFFPFVEKNTNIVNKKVFFLSRTKVAFVTVTGIIYFTIGILGLLWGLYVWQAMAILTIIFTPFIIEKLKNKYYASKGIE